MAKYSMMLLKCNSFMITLPQQNIPHLATHFMVHSSELCLLLRSCFFFRERYFTPRGIFFLKKQAINTLPVGGWLPRAGSLLCSFSFLPVCLLRKCGSLRSSAS